MNFAGERLRALIASRGEDFEVASVAKKGLFSILTFGQAATYVSFTVLDLATKPYYLLVVPFDDGLAVSDTFDRGGRTFEVLHVNDIRYMNEIVGRVALVA